ncbi:CHAT domain-containing protein [Nocardia gipuzkoensis]
MASAIELEIGPGPGDGEYTARVVRSPVGAEPPVTVCLDVDRLLSERDGLEDAVYASGIKRRGPRSDERLLQQVGKLLFEALFTDSLMVAYRASVAETRRHEEDLQIKLRITVPKLAALPWEALWDPDTNRFICLEEPLVRHVSALHTPDPPEVTPPLRVLGVAASPRDMQPLNVITEQERMNRALTPLMTRGLLELEWLLQPTWESMHAKLLSHQWHVLHFIGHGEYDAANDEGLIYLIGPDQIPQPIRADRLATLILSARRPTPQLVVLNTCSSSKESSNDLFAGTAATLARRGISAVAAMQFTITDEAAVSFATGFYTAVAHGLGIDDAVRHGRVAIAGVSHTLEWVTPVLYLRGENTHLFIVKPKPGAQSTTESPPPTMPAGSRQINHLRAMFVQARAELRQGHYDTALTVLNQLLDHQPDYPGAAALCDTVVRELDLAERFQQAVDEQDADNLTVAANLFQQILDEKPGYRDADQRLEWCREQQQIADLQTQLRGHADVGDWKAVITVSDKLAVLDPDKADPDGLTSRARRALRDEARAEEERQHYTQARAAEKAGDWKTAIDSYVASGRHSDSATRLEWCREQQQIADLQTQLRGHADVGDWKAVITVSDKLAVLDPDKADPDGLTSRARRALRDEARAEEERQHYTQARAAEKAGDWKTAIGSYVASGRHSDSATRLERCRQQQQIAVLRSQLDEYVKTTDWRNVLSTIHQLTTLVPAATPYLANLEARARYELTSSQPPVYRPDPSPAAPATNHMAIWALYLSIVPLVGVIGIPLGVMALAQLRSKPQQKGRGIAWASILLGMAWISFFVISALVGDGNPPK